MEIINIIMIIIAVILGVIGIVGSVVPALPGPPLSWIGLLFMYIWGGTNASGEPMSLKFLIIWLAIATLVTIIDYFVPAFFTKISGGSKYAAWGAGLGLLAGMIIPPIGMIAGSIIGAFLAELIFSGKDASGSMKSAAAAFAGFILGTGMKLIVSGVMLYYIIVYI